MKPTPTQGRALCFMAAHSVCVILSRGRATVEFDRRATDNDPEHKAYYAFRDAFAKADLKGLRRASVEACMQAGWMVEEQFGPNDWNRGIFITEAGREIAALLGPEDLKDRPRNATPLLDLELIYGALRGKWPSADGWVWFREIGLNGRRLDALAVNRWRGKHAHKRMAFEIKRTRGDFLAELKKPEKRLEGGAIADCVWFATPANLVTVDEIPGDCGLVWIDEDGRVFTKRKAPQRSEPAPTTRSFLGAILTYIVDRPDQQEWRKAMRDL